MTRSWLALTVVFCAGCKELVHHTPLPHDPRYGTVALEYSPLQPLSALVEYHGTSVTMVAFQKAGFDLNYKAQDAQWVAKRFSLPDFKTTDLPVPPLKLTNSFNMALPVGTADVDAIFTGEHEFAIRDGQTWTVHASPDNFVAVDFMVVSGPQTVVAQSVLHGVWVLRGEAWVQLAPDLGDRTYLVAVDGDRVRLVSGQPIDPQTMLPVGKATIALISASTGARLAPDVIPGDRFTGLAMTGLNGTVDDFTLYLGEKRVRDEIIRTTRFVNGALVRGGQNQLPYDNGYATVQPLPGVPSVVFASDWSLQSRVPLAPCACEIRKDASCGCVNRLYRQAVLAGTDLSQAVAVVLVTEEARTHLALRFVDLTKPVDPLSLIDPASCSPQCQAPLACLPKLGGFACSTPPVVPDAGSLVPVTLTAHLVVPPGVDAGAMNIFTEKFSLENTYPAYDIVQYGPDVKVTVDPNVPGRLVFAEPTLGLNANRTWNASPPGTTIDFGDIHFGAPISPFATGPFDLEVLNIDIATGFMLANVNGHLSYLEPAPSGFRFRDTQISAPTSIQYFPNGGVAFVTSAAGTSLVPNGYADGGVAPPLTASVGVYDFAHAAISPETGTFVLPRIVTSGQAQQPATWFDTIGQRIISEAGEAEALSADGVTLIRREGNDLVRRSRHTNGRTVFISDLAGPAAFLVATDTTELTYEPEVVIVEGATPRACLLGTGAATCSLRLRPSGGSFTTPISSAAKFVAMTRDGAALLFDEGQGLIRYVISSGAKAPIALPSAFVVREVAQARDTVELFGTDGRIVIYDLTTNTTMRVLPAAARLKRGSYGGIVQADACGAGEPCAVQSYFPLNDELINFGPGSGRRTILNTGELVSLENDTLSVLSRMPGVEPRVISPAGFHAAFLPGFDDAVATFGASCSFFTADADFMGSVRFVGCAH